MTAFEQSLVVIVCLLISPLWMSCHVPQGVADTKSPEVIIENMTTRASLTWVSEIRVDAGEDFLDVTLKGRFPSGGRKTTKIHVFRFADGEIVILPVHNVPKLGTLQTTSFVPFEEAFRIPNLSSGTYHIHTMAYLPSGYQVLTHESKVPTK